MENGSMACTAILLSSLVFYCPDVLAQCSLNIQSSINSGWNKKNVSYSAEKNALKIKVGDGVKDDADSIYIGSVKGCSTLTIAVSQISGNYPWEGKVIGFSFFNDKLEPYQWGNQASFPSPRGRAIEDGFVKSGLLNNTKLVYDIANTSEPTYIGAKVFVGRNNALELQFSAQEVSRELKLSARQFLRSPQRYISNIDQRSENLDNSCSFNCHEPRTPHRQFAYTRDFQIPPSAACPDGRD